MGFRQKNQEHKLSKHERNEVKALVKELTKPQVNQVPKNRARFVEPRDPRRARKVTCASPACEAVCDCYAKGTSCIYSPARVMLAEQGTAPFLYTCGIGTGSSQWGTCFSSRKTIAMTKGTTAAGSVTTWFAIVPSLAGYSDVGAVCATNASWVTSGDTTPATAGSGGFVKHTALLDGPYAYSSTQGSRYAVVRHCKLIIQSNSLAPLDRKGRIITFHRQGNTLLSATSTTYEGLPSYTSYDAELLANGGRIICYPPLEPVYHGSAVAPTGTIMLGNNTQSKFYIGYVGLEDADAPVISITIEMEVMYTGWDIPPTTCFLPAPNEWERAVAAFQASVGPQNSFLTADASERGQTMRKMIQSASVADIPSVLQVAASDELKQSGADSGWLANLERGLAAVEPIANTIATVAPLFI